MNDNKQQLLLKELIRQKELQEELRIAEYLREKAQSEHAQFVQLEYKFKAGSSGFSGRRRWPSCETSWWLQA